MERNLKSKYWVFTLNNYDEKDEDILKNLYPNEVSYLVYGREIGANETPHLQGYIEFINRKALSTIKKINTRIHWEKRKGTALEASTYCKKDDDRYFEIGTISKGQGFRTDLHSVCIELIENKRPLHEVSLEFPTQFIKYHKGFKELANLVVEPRTWPTEVFVLWGATGTGKTKFIYDNHELKDIYVHPGNQWFDGYKHQPIALFDDFCGSSFPISYLLKLLDRYPFKVPIKGGYVEWVPKTIYITSNIDPQNWYMNANPEHVRALKRRFTKVTHFNESLL